jgi:glycosyltransferase involved in cell wall biosynthesis
MKFIFTSYVSSPEFNQPEDWLKRINGYTGILESLSTTNTVIGIERINYNGVYNQNGVTYYFTRLKNKKNYFPWRLHRLIKKLKPDVVFINGFIFPLQIIQLRLTLGNSIRIIVLHRAERPFLGVKKYFQKLADRCVNAYLFTSAEFGRRWMESGIIKEPKKIYEVIQASSVFHAADKLIARSALAISCSRIFLWVGRLDDNKDPLTVVKAFIEFLPFQPSSKLYMIYQSEELLQEVINLVREDTKTADAIKFVGKVVHEQLQNWYNSVDFIISGSHYEGSGVAVCEAMSCGCIPVVTNIASFRKMTGPGKCGLLYKPGSHKDLLAVLLQTIELNFEKEREKTLEQFENELSFKAIARKINGVVTSLYQIN